MPSLLARPWSSLVLGVTLAILTGTFAVASLVDYARAPGAPLHATVAEAASGRLGRTWVYLDDACFHAEEEHSIGGSRDLDRVVPITDAARTHTIIAHPQREGLVPSGLLEPEREGVLEQLDAESRPASPAQRFRPGWTPADDRFFALFLIGVSAFLLAWYPLDLALARGAERTRGPISKWDIRAASCMPLLVAGLLLTMAREDGRLRPYAFVAAGLDGTVGLLLAALAHTPSLQRLLLRLDRAHRGAPPAPRENVTLSLPLPALVALGGAPYVLEPELAPPPPRPISVGIRHGPFLRMRRRVEVGSVMLGAALLLAGLSGALDGAASYVLPLRFTAWLGAFLLGLGLLGALLSRRQKGPLHIFREGVTVSARIVRVERAIHMKLQSNALWVTRVVLDLAHPETGEPMRFEVRSPGHGPDEHISLRAGDVKTAIFLPGKFEETLTLYGFLDLTDASTLIPHKRGGAREAVAIAGILALLVALALGAFSLARYGEPLEFAPWAYATSAALGVATAITATLAVRRRVQPARRARSDALLVGGLVVFVAPIAWGIAFVVANEVLDRSAPEYRVVTIKQVWDETHAFILRSYYVEYADPVRGVQRFEVEADLARRLEASELGALELRRGALGWRWLHRINPARRVRDAGGERTYVETFSGQWLAVAGR